MKIALFGNSYQREKSAQAKRLFEALERHGADLYVCEKFYRFLASEMGLSPRVAGLIRNDRFEADVVLSLGGDGTFLKSAERVGDKGIPILGINTGRLGFLADVSGNEIEETVTELFKNYYRIEERTLLQLESPELPAGFYPYALNEIAVSKQDSSSMISIHTCLDGNYLTTYHADGLIVSTPSGSTAYSLSVGGPILVPSTANFVLTAVAPHSLNVRPLVIGNDCRVTLRVESRSQNYLIGVDGRSLLLSAHRELTIRKAPFAIRVVKRHKHLFYDTLREKLMWGADRRE